MNELYYRPVRKLSSELNETQKIAVKKRQLKAYAVFVYTLFVLSVILLIVNLIVL